MVEWVPPSVGARLRKAAPPGDPGELAHVMALVETPDDGTHVVIRSWWPTKRRWNYQVIGASAFIVGLWRAESSRPAASASR